MDELKKDERIPVDPRIQETICDLDLDFAAAVERLELVRSVLSMLREFHLSDCTGAEKHLQTFVPLSYLLDEIAADLKVYSDKLSTLCIVTWGKSNE